MQDLDKGFRRSFAGVCIYSTNIAVTLPSPSPSYHYLAPLHSIVIYVSFIYLFRASNQFSKKIGQRGYMPLGINVSYTTQYHAPLLTRMQHVTRHILLLPPKFNNNSKLPPCHSALQPASLLPPPHLVVCLLALVGGSASSRRTSCSGT